MIGSVQYSPDTYCPLLHYRRMATGIHCQSDYYYDQDHVDVVKCGEFSELCYVRRSLIQRSHPSLIPWALKTLLNSLTH